MRPTWCKMVSVVTCLGLLCVLSYRGLVDDSVQPHSPKSAAAELSSVAAKAQVLAVGATTSGPFAVHAEVNEVTVEDAAAGRAASVVGIWRNNSGAVRGAAAPAA